MSFIYKKKSHYTEGFWWRFNIILLWYLEAIYFRTTHIKTKNHENYSSAFLIKLKLTISQFTILVNLYNLVYVYNIYIQSHLAKWIIALFRET